MEHEDNAHLDNFLQDSQQLMGNLQMASGDSMCDNVVDEIGGNIGGKFDEHEEHDDEEWKYIKEGQQSEKQQQMKAGTDCKDIEGVEEIGNGYENANEHGDVGAGGIAMEDQHEIDVDNGVVGISAAVDVDVKYATGIENEDVELDIKNDGDFSTTSNTMSTNGEDADVGTGVLQVEMKIEQAPVDHLLSHQCEELSVKCITEEDDEPSSLATNTTNGTNSLSENGAKQQIEQTQTERKFDEEFSMEDKENADPLLMNDGCSDHNDAVVRPNDLDFEMHSQLNPNALEFVPSFGSNPTSPIATMTDDAKFIVAAPNFNIETNLQPHPTAIPHHLHGDDDFVAQSPRKGSGESNLDGIAIPEENDFEDEAAKRPHELEQEDDLIAATTVQQTEQEPQLDIEQLESHNKDTVSVINEDSLDYQHQSQSSLIDHGPETCVDLDIDIATSQQEFSKGVIDESIQDVLNTVQQLPIEFLNASFDEDLLPQGTVAEKELLDVEEKENISNSPSTEEMQRNIQNELHYSEKDIPQIPIDMDSAAHMQESFYIESTSSGNHHDIDQPLGAQVNNTDTGLDELNVYTDGYQIAGRNIAMEENIGIDEMSFETMRAAEPNTVQQESEEILGGSPTPFNLFASGFTHSENEIGGDLITPSPISTEEKHLVEETKEQSSKNETVYELEQKMDSLIFSTKDEILSQVEEVAQTAANIVEFMNPFSSSEPEQHEKVKQSSIEADHPFTTESQPHADLLQQNEQFYHGEQKEQHQTQENEPEPAYGHHENDLFSAQPVDQPTASPVKMEFDMNGFENSVPASFSFEDNIVTSAEHEKVSSNDPLLQSTSLAQPEALVIEPKHQILVSEPENYVQPEPMPMHVLKTELQPTLEEGSDIISNMSTGDETLLVPSETLASISADATLAPVIDEPKSSTEEEFIAAASVGAIAAAATAVSVAAKTEKKADLKKPPTPTPTKAKALDIKKATEPIKKPIGTKTSAARPRTAPVKTTTNTEKKPAITSTVTKSMTTTATRKPLTSTTTTTKPITKTAAARPTTAPTASKAAAARTTTSTTARRSVPTTTGGSAATSNGTATTKPKPISGAPTKPTTLGLSTTAKPKLSSPRTTLTSQIRKTAPTNTGLGISAAKSPIKATAPTTNGISKSLATATTASRAKSSTSTTTTTATTKTFTARPAPKTTHSTTISSTTRRTVGSLSSSSTIGTKTVPSTTLQKKTSPGNHRPTASGKYSLSPTKTSSATLKVKTKDVPKKAATPIKSTNELNQKTIKEQSQTNGAAGAEAEGGIENLSENKAQLNGKGNSPHEQLENGLHHMQLENGTGSVLEHHIQAPLIDA